MTTLNAVRLRATLADTLNQVAYAHERVIVEKHGKPVAALVPMEDLEMLRALEDRIDLEAAREALAERGASRPSAEVKAELGL
jgi:prevent-host-death family protein